MKPIAIILLSIFTIGSLQAQISITKRKHRGGFHIETNFKRNKVAKLYKNEVKEAAAPRAKQAELVSLAQKEFTSVQSENTIEASLRLPNYEEKKSHKALRTTPKWLASKFNYLPSGAAWIKKITDPPKKEVKHIKAKNTFAIVGFVCGLLSLLTLALVAGFFLMIPGLVFSILGFKSPKYRKFAIAGFVLSLITIFLVIVAITLYIIIFSNGNGRHY